MTNAAPTYPMSPTPGPSVTHPPMMEPIAMPTLKIPENRDMEMAVASEGDARRVSFWNVTLNEVANSPQRAQTSRTVARETTEGLRSSRHTAAPSKAAIMNLNLVRS